MAVGARRLGVFGGTFDPPHHGHLIVAAEVHERLALDRLLFVPAADPPHKAVTGATPGQRVRMLRAALDGDERFAVDELEIDRGGASYTVDTLRELRAREGERAELFFLLGADQYRVFGSWREPREVARLARLTVMGRAGGAVEPGPAYPARVVEVSRIDISSTAIRQRVSEGRSVRYWVPEAVREMIEAERMYG